MHFIFEKFECAVLEIIAPKSSFSNYIDPKLFQNNPAPDVLASIPLSADCLGLPALVQEAQWQHGSGVEGESFPKNVTGASENVSGNAESFQHHGHASLTDLPTSRQRRAEDTGLITCVSFVKT